MCSYNVFVDSREIDDLLFGNGVEHSHESCTSSQLMESFTFHPSTLSILYNPQNQQNESLIELLCQSGTVLADFNSPLIIIPPPAPVPYSYPLPSIPTSQPKTLEFVSSPDPLFQMDCSPKSGECPSPSSSCSSPSSPPSRTPTVIRRRNKRPTDYTGLFQRSVQKLIRSLGHNQAWSKFREMRKKSDNRCSVVRAPCIKGYIEFCATAGGAYEKLLMRQEFQGLGSRTTCSCPNPKLNFHY